MSRRCRLYLITPPEIPDLGRFVRELGIALDAGDVASLQIRLKNHAGVPAPDAQILEAGRHIVRRAQDRGVAVLVNDRPDLAKQLEADGVHIGQSDASYADARKTVGKSGIVGITCHDSRHLAMVAGEAGADYVAFGAFHPTQTKNAPTKAEPEILSWWQELFEIPCVAIGGVTVENAAPLVQAGADFLAVSAGVWQHPKGPAYAVAAFNELFDKLEG